MHALDRLGLEAGEPSRRSRGTATATSRLLRDPVHGRVLHTLNLRLSPEDLAYIIGHADDRAIIVDPDLLPLLEKIGDGTRQA